VNTRRVALSIIRGVTGYELFTGCWGAQELARAALEDPGDHQIAAALNTPPKYPRIDHAHRPAMGGHDRPPR
jgi:hypothetical protein